MKDWERDSRLPTRPLSAVGPGLITGLEGRDPDVIDQSAVIRLGYGHYRQIRLVAGAALGGPITRDLGRTDAIFSSRSSLGRRWERAPCPRCPVGWIRAWFVGRSGRCGGMKGRG